MKWYLAPLGMVQNLTMRLDHVSYVTSHDQLSDTVQRLGSLIGNSFVDGGIHPRFGTRNFTTALVNGQYIEIVCPLDHPATESSSWGKAVARKAEEGGGWLTWVFSTDNLIPYANKFGRSPVEGHRMRPNGSDLRWMQIGLKEIAEVKEFPFFIQWLTEDHPSQDGPAFAEIKKIVLATHNKLEDSWFKEEILSGLGAIEIEWVNSSSTEQDSGIIEIEISTPRGTVVLD
jgi:hypothetical protein